MPQMQMQRTQTSAKGAYFRKVTSEERPTFYGIQSIGTLPAVALDPSPGRYFAELPGRDVWLVGPLDRPSVYVGGNGNGVEVDAGFSWDRIYLPGSVPTYTDLPGACDGNRLERRFVFRKTGDVTQVVSAIGTVAASGDAEVKEFRQRLHPNFAFRPFWRTRGIDWGTAQPGSDPYFFPGERIILDLRISSENVLRLTVSLDSDDHERTFSHEFHAEGFARGSRCSFKRVNAIDQFWEAPEHRRRGRETLGVVPTASTVLNARWHQVLVFSDDGSSLPLAAPMAIEVISDELASRYSRIFTISDQDENGSERIDIHPSA